ncbi:HNH endonuclease [Candidatus Uhrbacteria bacterium]|nr:HNH endonuclease [Candidatus Uhrbacteria bacterium]
MPNVECQRCTAEFYIKPSHQRLGYGKFCTRKCADESKKSGKYVFCEICSKKTWKTPKDFKKSKSGLFFCTKSCQTKWRNAVYSGKNHPLWVDGGSTYRNVLLKSGVKQKCRICKSTDRRILIVHHIDKNRKNNRTENLAWLCHNCHFLVHHDKKVYRKFMVSVV